MGRRSRYRDEELDTPDGLEKARGRAFHELSGGLIGCCVWGLAWFFLFHAKWVLFPLIFMGFLPLVSALRGIVSVGIAAPASKRKALESARLSLERDILRLAAEREGILTPALVSVQTGRSLDEAQSALDAMAAKGQVELKVLESGRIEYRFPEFEAE